MKTKSGPAGKVGLQSPGGPAVEIISGGPLSPAKTPRPLWRVREGSREREAAGAPSGKTARCPGAWTPAHGRDPADAHRGPEQDGAFPWETAALPPLSW